VACGLATIALAGPSARAGNVMIVVSEAGVGSLSIFLGSGLEGPGATSNNVTADKAALNSALNAAGFDFNFNALGAIANSPAAGIDASLFLTGQVFRTTSTGGDKTITIDATQNDYTSLSAMGGVLTSFSTANFFPAAGGISQVGTSYFATSNTQNDTSGPNTTAPTFTPPGGSGHEPPINVPKTAVFSLTNRIVVKLASDTTGGMNPPIDQFTHSTTVTAVPEPASVAMLSMGMPVAFMGLMWLRRRRAMV
jgi:hypothetical protein